MDWINGFLVPLTQVILIIGILIILLYIFLRCLKIIWSRWLKHFIKYRLLGNKINLDTIEFIKPLKEDEIRKELMIRGFSKTDIYELIYLKKIFGGKNDRPTKEDDR